MESIDQLLSALHRDLDPQLLEVLLTGIKTLAKSVRATDVDQVKTRIIAITTEAIHMNVQVMRGLIEALDALPGEITTSELVELLKSPLGTGKAEASVLELIEKRTKLRFDGNPWKLVAQAKEAGLDPQIFRNPPQRPKTVAPLESSE